MQSFDVLIVGGGPAGSSLAYHLKDTQLSVAIMDKRTFPRNKVCAGWITPEVLRLLNIDADEYAQQRVLQKISGFQVSLFGECPLQIDYPTEAVSYGIRRLEFDDYLLRRCGAHLITGEPFKDMQKTEKNSSGDKTWLVNGQYKADLIVGAGGNFCPVARLMNADKGQEISVVAQEMEFEMDALQLNKCTVNEHIPELFFTRDLLGYGWAFRKGNYLNIGLGREDNKNLSSQVKEFYQYLISQGKIPPHIEDKFNGHAYVLRPNARRKIVGDHTLLIGDAAGLAYAKSGEGIRPAVESAVLAAEVIRNSQNAFRKYDHSKKALQIYQDHIDLRFGKGPEKSADPGAKHHIGNHTNQPVCDAQPRQRGHYFLKNKLAHQLLKTHWFIKNIVINKWFLRHHQKPLSVVIGAQGEAANK